ncbi:MAG: hypothetical protein OSA88_10290 [Acidimicrobiales bacterium]|nr:hypothetical protein [Acidimicrobiales bacterium]
MKDILPQILLLPVLFWLVWGADIWTAVSLMYPAYIIIALISCGLLLLPFAFVRRPAVAVVPGIWLVFLLVFPFVTNSSLKPLMRGVRDLEQGIDHDAILVTLKSRYAGTKYPDPVVHSEEQWNSGSGSQRITRLCIKPPGRDPELQAESLLVFLEDGRFTHASFSAD